MKRFVQSAFLLMAIIFGAAEAAAQQSMTFVVRNETTAVVNYKLWSATRNHVWPTASSMYALNFKGDQRANKINCVPGEKICYGAWFAQNPRIIWGAGPTGKGKCADCCYTCNGTATKVKVLTYTPRQSGTGR